MTGRPDGYLLDARTFPSTQEHDVSETNGEDDAGPGHDTDQEREEIAAVDEELEARSDAEGLAAEAGSGEETGLTEG